jgi:hypothetical protein
MAAIAVGSVAGLINGKLVAYSGGRLSAFGVCRDFHRGTSVFGGEGTVFGTLTGAIMHWHYRSRYYQYRAFRVLDPSCSRIYCCSICIGICNIV